jgi:hypothetical protein
VSPLQIQLNGYFTLRTLIGIYDIVFVLITNNAIFCFGVYD